MQTNSKRERKKIRSTSCNNFLWLHTKLPGCNTQFPSGDMTMLLLLNDENTFYPSAFTAAALFPQNLNNFANYIYF